MGKILRFDNYRQSTGYRDAVRDLDEMLERHTQELTSMALNLAAAGVWKQWDATQPTGSVLHLDPGDLANTDDALVSRLMALCDRIDEVREAAAGSTAREREP